MCVATIMTLMMTDDQSINAMSYSNMTRGYSGNDIRKEKDLRNSTDYVNVLLLNAGWAASSKVIQGTKVVG